MDARIDIPDHAPHVLVVDDDRRLRDLLTRFLTENGYRVTAASSAAEARAKAGNFVFDALVLDVMMPGETGFDYARRIRETSQVPILMLTARADASDRVTGLEIGADDYLSKPFERGELRQGDEVVRITEREREIMTILGSRGGGNVAREELAGNGIAANERTV